MRYVSNIAEFLKFIMDNNDFALYPIKEDFSVSTKSKNSYNFKIKHFIEGHKNLRNENIKEPVSQEEIEQILKICNSTLDSQNRADYLKSAADLEDVITQYNESKIALILKFIVLTGVSYEITIKDNYFNMNNELNKKIRSISTYNLL